MKDISWMNTLQEADGLTWKGSKSRIGKRAGSVSANPIAKQNERHVGKVCASLNLKRHWKVAKIKRNRINEDSRRQRRTANHKNRSDWPSLFVEHVSSRSTLFQCYRETFLANLQNIKKRGVNAELSALHLLYNMTIKQTWAKSEELALKRLRNMKNA